MDEIKAFQMPVAVENAACSQAIKQINNILMKLDKLDYSLLVKSRIVSFFIVTGMKSVLDQYRDTLGQMKLDLIRRRNQLEEHIKQNGNDTSRS